MKEPGNSIYVGALVSLRDYGLEQLVYSRGELNNFKKGKRLESWFWHRDTLRDHRASYRDKWVDVFVNDVGIVFDKCQNGIIRSPDRTWLVTFPNGSVVIRQTEIVRVSFSWKESKTVVY